MRNSGSSLDWGSMATAISAQTINSTYRCEGMCQISLNPWSGMIHWE
uniref:Pco087306 n=1 Tax=Arundo donax TaxID=35708 RepID=A0A0A9EW54_ARUDO